MSWKVMVSCDEVAVGDPWKVTVSVMGAVGDPWKVTVSVMGAVGDP